MPRDGGVGPEQVRLLDGDVRERVLTEDAARVETGAHEAARARQRLQQQQHSANCRLQNIFLFENKISLELHSSNIYKFSELGAKWR